MDRMPRSLGKLKIFIVSLAIVSKDFTLFMLLIHSNYRQVIGVTCLDPDGALTSGSVAMASSASRNIAATRELYPPMHTNDLM